MSFIAILFTEQTDRLGILMSTTIISAAGQEQGAYDDIVAKAVLAAVAASPLVILAPVADIAAIGTIWTTMTVSIARRGGLELDTATAKRMTMAVIGAGGAYWGGSKLFTSILGKIPFSVPAAVGVNGALNGIYTARLGQAIVELVEASEFDLQDWDFIVGTLSAAMAPRPSKAEFSRVVRIWRRYSGRGPSR